MTNYLLISNRLNSNVPVDTKTIYLEIELTDYHRKQIVQ